MEYVQMLRARRVLTWFTGVVVAGLVIEAISYYTGHGSNHGDGTVAFSSITGAVSIAALIIATFVAPGLSSEAANTTALVWTRPAPRETIAVRLIGIDVAAILIGYVVGLAAALISVAIVGELSAVTYDPAGIVRSIMLGLGGALMWYALISVAAARLPGRGPLLAGLTWGVFPVAASLLFANLPVWLHDVIYALDYLNPVAWMGNSTPQDTSGIIPLSVWQRVFGEWAIAIVALVASVRLWSTREV